MSIPTQMSLAGFIARAPERHVSDAGHVYARVRIGIEHWRKEVSGPPTKLDPTFHDMVAFDTAAEQLCARFRVGDSFVASGYVHEYEVEGCGEIKEEFVARKIRHNANRHTYEVTRRQLARDSVRNAGLPTGSVPGM